MSREFVPYPPRKLPERVNHGNSRSYGHYGCRCCCCLEYRRAYDRGRDRYPRNEDWHREHRLHHSRVVWTFRLEDAPDSRGEVQALRVSVPESVYRLTDQRRRVVHQAIREFTIVRYPGARPVRNWWYREILHEDEIKRRQGK